MDNVKRYDLKGLKFFLIGLILSVFPFVSIVGFILILIGFFKLAHIKDYFRRSRNFYIGSIIFAILYVCTVVLTMIPFLALIPALMYALMVLFEYKADKYMIFGCNEIAVENNDMVLSEKLMRIYRVYKIAMIIGCILSFLLAFIPFISFIGIIITTIGLLIIKIFMVYRFYQTYEKYHIGHEGNVINGPTAGNTGDFGPENSAGGGSYGGAYNAPGGNTAGTYGGYDKNAGGAASGTGPHCGPDDFAGSGGVDNEKTSAGTTAGEIGTGAFGSAEAATGAGAGVAAAGAGAFGAANVAAAEGTGNADNTAGAAREQDNSSEDPVTMLLRPEIELEYIAKKVLPHDDEKTVILETGIPTVTLTSLSGNERIEVDKDGFILGRSREKTDHRISNPSVSSVHAKIHISENGCFAEDMNSSNHSYINGKMIGPDDSGILIGALNNGDILKLAEEEFKVEISANIQDQHKTQGDDEGGYFIAESSKTGEKTDIKKNSFTLGRDKGDADLKVSSENTVGRLHASIHVDPETEKVFIKDENSSNGTFVNGVKLSAGEETEVHDKDEIKLSNVVIRFRKLENTV